MRDGLETHLRCCPQCYHKSPYPFISPRLICSQCPNDKCSASVVYSEVCPCPQCRQGKMILNRAIDKFYYLTCNFNKCNYSLIVVQNAAEVKRSQSLCPTCSSFKLRVVPAHQVYSMNRIDCVEACVFCDERYKNYIMEPNVKGKLEAFDGSRHSQTPRAAQSSQGFEQHQAWAFDPLRRKEAKRKVNNGVKLRKRDNNLAFEAAGAPPGAQPQARDFEDFSAASLLNSFHHPSQQQFEPDRGAFYNSRS